MLIDLNGVQGHDALTIGELADVNVNRVEDFHWCSGTEGCDHQPQEQHFIVPVVKVGEERPVGRR